jgi:hypothetical protein
VLKIINAVAYVTLDKPLDKISILKDKDWFAQFKNYQNTALISLYGMQIKTIVDNPIKYINQIKQKLLLALDQEKNQQIVLKTIFLIELLQKNPSLLCFDTDQKRMEYIVNTSPKSNIPPEQFALAFTSFAQLRESSLRKTQK